MVMLIVVLVVFGPQRIPEIARLLAKATKMFQEASREIQRQLEVSEWESQQRRRKISRKPKPSTGEDDFNNPYPESEDMGYGHSELGNDSPYNENNEVMDAETVSRSNGETHNHPSGEGHEEPTVEHVSSPKANQPLDEEKLGDAKRYARELSD
jgi:TatA/E family protein of Tat protein translocase